MDVLTPAQRRLNMSRIRGKDTKPELLVRRGLHAAGLRYRLHVRSLPGSPDLVFPRYRAVIFVHGCFWHGHRCPRFRLPHTRRNFWKQKIAKSRLRDNSARRNLRAGGWRVLTVWECALTGTRRQSLGDLISSCSVFVRGRSLAESLEGRPARHRASMRDPVPGARKS